MAFLGAIWGVVGVLLLVGVAILRLTPPAIASFSYDLEWYHWLLLLVNSPLALYLKGYRGFYHGLSKRVAVRAQYAARHPTIARLVLCPLFCMGYIQMVRRKQIATIAMMAGMVLLILLVRQFEQPLRGIIDLGIVMALTVGWISILYHGVKALSGGEIDFPVMVDEPSQVESGLADPILP